MLGYFLDRTTLDPIYIVDVFESFIWTIRYDSYGDFELEMPMDENLINTVKMGDYIRIQEDNHLMIVEKISSDFSVNDGRTLTIIGKSLESLLARRVVWDLESFEGNLQDAVKTLVEHNITSPTNSKRRIPKIYFKESKDTKVTEPEVTAQYQGDTVYSAIQDLCTLYNLGFRIILSDTNGFEFMVYAGTDRTKERDGIIPVVFSQQLGNLASSNYCQSIENFANAALVGGQGEGDEKILVEATTDDSEGLDRFEIYYESQNTIDKTGVPDEDADGDGTVSPFEKAQYEAAMKIATDKYKKVLETDGKVELQRYSTTVMFDGDIEYRIQYKINQDYYLGDIVRVVNEFGKLYNARITEIIFSQDSEGVQVVPTFTVLDDVVVQ